MWHKSTRKMQIRNRDDEVSNSRSSTPGYERNKGSNRCTHHRRDMNRAGQERRGRRRVDDDDGKTCVVGITPQIKIVEAPKKEKFD